MCGIAGIWGGAEEGRLLRAVRALRHRGPDDEGVWFDRAADIGLGQRRLSIIDLAGGHQPMSNEDGSIWLVFNGEIYNYLELRDELIAAGHRFATNSDTETIVHLYEQDGIDFPKRLRGMFTVAIWDGRRRQLVLARDRLGKKPLYYSETPDGFVFGSEIKSVAAALSGALDIDDQALTDYLGWGFVPAPRTIYRQVRLLESASAIVVRERRISARTRYWHFDVLQKDRSITAAEAVERVDAALRESVRLRLRADVPVGAFLSGGIDSGLVTAMAAQQYPGKLLTVSIGFEEGGFDERPLARLVAERYGTDHREVVVRCEAGDILPQIASAFDQPYANTSAIPNYYVAREARRHLKVVLTGDGGDEILAGYRRYFAARLNAALGFTDNPLGRLAWQGLRAVLPRPRSFRTPYAFAQRIVRGMAVDPVTRHFLWGNDMLGAADLPALCGGRSWARQTQPAERIVSELFAEYAGAHPVDRMMAVDARTTLVDGLNLKLDICTMQHSLEARSPLLDHVLIDTVNRFPASVKLHGRKTKPLLRTLAERYLPVEVCTAPKRGFEVPLLHWLENDLRQVRDDIILSPSGLLAERFDRAALERLVRRQTPIESGRWATQVIVLLMLGVWDRYVRRSHAAEPPRGAALGAPVGTA
ncbi:MAG: asparagine synthase (glutamine-hydrolyzing) [Planctomycetia bacterium]|nr:MAG: asparagine synthase (glutamine-hydrolyzing) [Planctomycetia bacterium]